MTKGAFTNTGFSLIELYFLCLEVMHEQEQLSVHRKAFEKNMIIDIEERNVIKLYRCRNKRAAFYPNR